MKELLISKLLYDEVRIKLPKGESSPFPGMKVHPIDPKLCKRTVQVKTHKKCRINKKWAKRYGFREEEIFYLIDPSKIKPMLNPKWSSLEEKKEDKAVFRVRLDFGQFG